MKDSAQGNDLNQKIVYIPSPADASAANALNHMDYDDWAYWYELDLDGEHDGTDTDKDGDGWTDKEEYFFLGSDPTSPAGYRTPILQMVTSSQSSASFEFPLSCFLYQPSALASPFELRDGSTLSIQRSPDLVNWTDCTSEVLGLQEAGDEGLTVTISFGIAIDPMVKTKCFYRIFVYQ